MPKVAQRVSGKGWIRTPSPRVPRLAPSSMRSLSLPSRAWARPGLCPREPWRPGALLQRAQTGSYSQAETCRILLCTTRQQHPCAGTDRNKAQVGKAQGSPCKLASPFLNVALRLYFIPLCSQGQNMVPLPVIPSFPPKSWPRGWGEGRLEEKDKIPALKELSLTGETNTYTNKTMWH